MAGHQFLQETAVSETLAISVLAIDGFFTANGLMSAHNTGDQAMSLFGFVKDIGRTLFNKDAEAAAAIKKHIEASNPGVTDLKVTFDHGIVGLDGECASAEGFQKCVLMAGNVKGVADVYTSGLKVKADAPDIVSSPPAAVPVSSAAATVAPAQQVAPQTKVEVEYYLIKSGDNLSKIAKQFYGNANLYPKIFEANKEVIEHPDKIFPGQKIRIPRS